MSGGEFYNPDSWMDVVDHLWIGLVFITIAGVPSWFAARNHRSIKDIKAQVVNGHEKPMREDLDRAISAIEALANDVGRLRHDLSSEEDRRRVQIDELRDDVDRMRRRP